MLLPLQVIESSIFAHINVKMLVIYGIRSKSSRLCDRILNLKLYQCVDSRYETESIQKFDCSPLSNGGLCFTIPKLQLDQEEESCYVAESSIEPRHNFYSKLYML